MITGSRALVPVLREVPGLRFDVMPIPSIEGQATVGEITGLCISQDAESPATSADFMVYASSTEAVSEVVRQGYLQPANQEVAFSDDFLQPTRDARLRHRLQRLGDPDGHPAAARHVGRARDGRRAVPAGRCSSRGRSSTCRCSASRSTPSRSRSSTPRRRLRLLRRSRRSRRSPRLRSRLRSLHVGSQHGVREEWGAQAYLPGAGAEVTQRDRDRPGQGLEIARLGRGPQHAAHEVGGQQVLGRQPQLLGRLGDRLASQLEPPGRDRVLVGPGPWWRVGRPRAAYASGSWASGRSRTCASTATQRPA